MIVSFGNRDTERLWQRHRVARLQGIARVALRKLRMLDAANTVEDLRSPPSNRLEKLKWDRAGQWSIRVNDQWRVCFRWKDGQAFEVEIVDYH